jgi:hypothetical protein
MPVRASIWRASARSSPIYAAAARSSIEAQLQLRPSVRRISSGAISGPLWPVFNGNASLIAVPTSPPRVSPPRRLSGPQLLHTLPGKSRGRAEGRKEIHANALKPLISGKEK